MQARRDRGREELPAFSPTLARWFGRYLRYYFRRHFSAVRLLAGFDGAALRARPIVVYANHPSWWDPIFFMLIHEKCFPERGMFGPMDAVALEKYGFMRRLGVFGVELGSPRGVATFLRTSRAVLARGDATLWITPQGRFCDARERPVELQPGLAHLVRSVPRLAMLPLAVEYPFLDERNPEALALFGRPELAEEAALADVAAWSNHLAQRLEATQDELAAAVRSRDVSSFGILVGGQVGVGGVYDLWRRLKAWSTGRAFRPGHREVRP